MEMASTYTCPLHAHVHDFLTSSGRNFTSPQSFKLSVSTNHPLFSLDLMIEAPMLTTHVVQRLWTEDL